MKVVSLFDGISGAQVALQRANIPVETYVAAEIDPIVVRLVQRRFPMTREVGDVQSLSVKGHVDLLIGGSPCQDLSIAGPKRRGLDGPRSKLFYDYLRILNECVPDYFIFENVASMTSADQMTISHALGQAPIFINASLVSAQSRRRLYWTNIPGITLPEDRGIKLVDILEDLVEPKYLLSQKALDYMARPGKDGRVKWDYGYHSDTAKDKSATVTSNYYKGVPNNVLVDRVHKRYRRFMPVECERLQTLDDDYTAGLSDSARYRAIGNGFCIEVIVHLLSFLPAKYRG